MKVTKTMDRNLLLCVSKTALRTKLSADMADHLAEVRNERIFYHYLLIFNLFLVHCRRHFVHKGRWTAVGFAHG